VTTLFTKPLITPLVNNNGATAQSLVAEQVAVIKALDAAIDAMAKATPHGRDFQTHTTAFADIDARLAWHERMGVLIALKAEVTNNALAIQKQGR
jgi:hypothetical protein